MSFDRFASRFEAAVATDEAGTGLSKGGLLRRLENLINEARQKLKTFEEGRTDHIGYVRKFRNRIQHCLLDIGQLAQDELHQIATLDLSISDGLQRYYDAGVFNDFDVKDGDPSEFLRLQNEYNRAMPSKIQRMIALMEQARDRMLGRPHRRRAPENASRRRRGPKPAMDRHKRIANVVTLYGSDWTRTENLARIASELDRQEIKVSKEWPKWNPPARSWNRAFGQRPERVVKAIKYSLKMASR